MNSSHPIKTTLLLLLLTSSCKKLLDVGNPTSSLNADQVFRSDETATAATVNVYKEMMRANGYPNGFVTKFFGLYADELCRPAAEPLDADAPFYYSALSPSDNTLSHFWTKAYEYINQANNVIEKLQRIPGTSEPVRKRLTGEARFIRALNYFYLVNIYGGVPKITSTDFRENMYKPRESEQHIYELIVSDLSEAVQVLPDPSENTDSALSIGTRASKWAAAALLARTHLYIGNWIDAEQWATVIITAGHYRLADSLNQVFQIQSPEIIFQMAPVEPEYNTPEAGFFLPFHSQAPLLVITPDLFNSFEAGDLRKKNWLGAFNIGPQTYHYPLKYKTRTSAPASEYQVVFRLAEIYLIRAEARARLHKLYGTTGAAVDLNQVRQQAGLPPLANHLPQHKFLLQIEKERWTEFFAEWGHRWFDLKRTEAKDSGNKTRAEEVIGALKPHFKKEQLLWPVPEKQLLLNKALQQNPGY